MAETHRGALDQLFTAHPRSLGMTWWGHGKGALVIGARLVGAGAACLVHAIVPGLFTETAGRTVVDIHDHIKRIRAGSPDPEAWSDYDI